MKLSEEQKKKMTEYYNYISNKMYGNKTKKERQKMGMFFTPSELGIQILEKFESLTEEDTVLDPTCGCGLLLAYSIIAGAKPEKCFGVELDPEMVRIAKSELGKLGVPEYNIHWGNALNRECFYFPESPYDDTFPRHDIIYSFSCDLENKKDLGKVQFFNKDGTEYIHFI